MAALCAAVGLGFSTGSLPIFAGLLDEEDEFEFEELAFLNFSLRLQAATTNTIATIRVNFFIESPKARRFGKQTRFTGTARACQIEFARLRFQARVSLSRESERVVSFSRSPSKVRLIRAGPDWSAFSEVNYAKNK